MKGILLVLACVFLIAAPSEAAWAYKTGSGASAFGAASPLTVALGASVSVGDRIIVVLNVNRATSNPSITSVADGTNTYNQDATSGINPNDTGFPQISSVYSAVVSGAGTPTVSLTFVGDGASIAVAAYSGLSTAVGAAAAVDVSTFGLAASATPTTAPASGNTANTTAANELVIGGYADDGYNTRNTQSGTQRTYVRSGTAEAGIADSDSGSSGTAQSTSGTLLDSAAIWTQFTVVYKLAGGAPPCVPMLTLLGVGQCG